MVWHPVRRTGLAAVVLAIALVTPGPVGAATFIVTDLGDSSAPGQLRTLINAAAFGDTIIIPAGTITLTGPAGDDDNVSGDLDINKNLTIQGAGLGVTIIDGGGIDRVFDVFGSSVVTISGMTIRNGNAGVGVSGGGIRHTSGALTLVNVAVSNNTAGQDGGGIITGATLTLTNVTVSGNTATRDGGGIITGDTLTLTNSTISGNQAPTGGGILNRGTLTLTNVTVSGNTASDEDGGGIRNEDTATLAGSTISGNSARLGGGVANLGSLTLTNVTISSNAAATFGGGIYNVSGGTATLTNVTIAENSGPFAGGICNGGGSVTLTNTIVEAGASGSNCHQDPPGGNCSGPITSQGHNMSADDSCISSFTAPGDHNIGSALLGPLQNNGGPTQTHALEAGGGSLAIDGGDYTGCPPLDQRGFVRPVDGDGNASALCDIGAFELVTAATTVLASVLPTERTAQAPGAVAAPGPAAASAATPVTAFATVLNTGTTIALGCALAPVTPVAATFLYQTTDAGNQLTGTANTPATIPPGGGQNYLFAFTPTGAFTPTEVQLSMACTNSTPAPVVSGVNTFRLRATATPVPDPVALAATGPPNDGIVRLASDGVFVVATVNLGAAGLLTVSTTVGALALTVLLCETDPATSLCLAPPTPTVQRQLATNETATFGVFVHADGPIPFDPANSRIQVHLEGGGGGGGTSVAVCSQPLCPPL